MSPYNDHQIDMEVLVKSPTPTRNCWEEGSVSSELSLDLLVKDHQEEREQNNNEGNNDSKGWDPDGSDYSLNILLPHTEDHHNSGDDSAHQDSCKSSQFGKSSMDYSMHSKASQASLDYSLNITLPRTKKKSQGKNIPKTSALLEETDDSKDASPDNTSDTEDDGDKIPQSVKSSKRRVKFYPRIRIQRVKNRKDLSERHIEAVWYSRDEFKEIRKECYVTIKAMTAGDDLEEEEGKYCSRGLEYKVPSLYKERQRSKADIRSAVFEEQEFQDDNHMFDVEYLAEVSREHSHRCVNAAIATALKDQLFARSYHREDS